MPLGVAPHAHRPRHSEWRRTLCHATANGVAQTSVTLPSLARPKEVIPVKYFQNWFIIWNGLKFELILFKLPSCSWPGCSCCCDCAELGAHWTWLGRLHIFLNCRSSLSTFPFLWHQTRSNKFKISL
jgi:hypothetical protein